MSALDDLRQKDDLTDLEVVILAGDLAVGKNDVTENAAAELAALKAIEKAAREYVNSRNERVKQFPKFQKLADALEKTS